MIKKLFLLLFITTLPVYAEKSSITFNGSFESIIDFAQRREYTGADWGMFSWGLNNYANLRFKAVINEYLTFGFAININTFSGNYTETYKYSAAGTTASLFDSVNRLINKDTSGFSKLNFASNNFFTLPFFYKSTYVGSFDLERIYLKAGNDYFDIEAGLIRIARGYGQIFSPTDFFNPKDPLNPNARPQGKMALVSTYYPADMWKIQLFTVAPDNPIDSSGWGFKFGAATQANFKKVNLEFLYTLIFPDIPRLIDPVKIGLPKYTNNDYTHIVGFSMKADVEVGLFIDAIYRFEQRELWYGDYYGKGHYYGYEGLEASIGIDYTINIPRTESKFYLLTEYLFYGSGMLDWWDKKLDGIYATEDQMGVYYMQWDKVSPLDRALNYDKRPQYLLRHDYILGLVSFTINSYATINTSYLFGIDDQSGLLTASIDVEPFQAMTINIAAMFPFGWDTIDYHWDKGEFGPINVGYYGDYKITVKVKF